MKYFSGMNHPVDAVPRGWELGTSFFWETAQPMNLHVTDQFYNLVSNIQGSKQNKPRFIEDKLRIVSLSFVL